MGFSVRVHDRTGAYQAKSKAKMVAAVTKAAFDIEARAKGHAPVDTGNLRSAINAEGSGLDWRVHSPVAYAVYQEFGTRFQPGKPHLIPALEEVRPTLMAALRSL